MVKRRRALSPVISEIILTAGLLAVALAVLIYSNSLLTAQSGQAEFEQAKVIVQNLANGVEDVGYGSAYTSYVRFNTRQGGPYVTNGGSTLAFYVTGQNQSAPPVSKTILSPTPIASVGYFGGSHVTTTLADLRGNRGDTYIWNSTSPLAYVGTLQRNGPYVTLNTTRVGITSLGIFNYTNSTGNGFESVSLYLVNMILLTKGSTSGSASIYEVATSAGVQHSTLRFEASNQTFTVTFSLVQNGSTVPGNSSGGYNVTIPANTVFAVDINISTVTMSLMGG